MRSCHMQGVDNPFMDLTLIYLFATSSIWVFWNLSSIFFLNLVNFNIEKYCPFSNYRIYSQSLQVLNYFGKDFFLRMDNESFAEYYFIHYLLKCSFILRNIHFFIIFKKSQFIFRNRFSIITCKIFYILEQKAKKSFYFCDITKIRQIIAKKLWRENTFDRFVISIVRVLCTRCSIILKDRLPVGIESKSSQNRVLLPNNSTIKTQHSQETSLAYG